MKFFSKAFTWFAELSQKLPQIEYKAFFIAALCVICGVALIIALTMLGSATYKLQKASARVIRYLKEHGSVDDDNLSEFSAQCFSTGAPQSMRDAWVQFLGVRFGYPSEIVSEQNVFDKEVKKQRDVRPAIFLGIALVVLAAFAFWGYGTLQSHEMGVIHCVGLILCAVLYVVLAVLSRKQHKRALEVFNEMQEDLDAKVNLQVEKNFAVDSSPIVEIASLIDEIIARNTNKDLGDEAPVITSRVDDELLDENGDKLEQETIDDLLSAPVETADEESEEESAQYEDETVEDYNEAESAGEEEEQIAEGEQEDEQESEEEQQEDSEEQSQEDGEETPAQDIEDSAQEEPEEEGETPQQEETEQQPFDKESAQETAEEEQAEEVSTEEETEESEEQAPADEEGEHAPEEESVEEESQEDAVEEETPQEEAIAPEEDVADEQDEQEVEEDIADEENVESELESAEQSEDAQIEEESAQEGEQLEQNADDGEEYDDNANGEEGGVESAETPIEEGEQKTPSEEEESAEDGEGEQENSKEEEKPAKLAKLSSAVDLMLTMSFLTPYFKQNVANMFKGVRERYADSPRDLEILDDCIERIEATLK